MDIVLDTFDPRLPFDAATALEATRLITTNPLKLERRHLQQLAAFPAELARAKAAIVQARARQATVADRADEDAHSEALRVMRERYDGGKSSLRSGLIHT